jgi:hypothetical protein
MFRFESSGMVVQPLLLDVTRIPNQDTYLSTLRRNIEPLIFRSIS